MPGRVERRRASRLPLAAAALGAGALLAAFLLRGAEERAAPGPAPAGRSAAETAAAPAELADPERHEAALPAAEEAAAPEALSAHARRVPVEQGPRGRTAVAESAAPLRGRLTDERTGEPVPRYRIELDARGQEEVGVVTDEQGRFETPVDLPLGEVRAWLSEAEDGRTLEHRRGQGAVAEHELKVRVGPTFFFDLDAPAGFAVDDLAVILLEPASVPRWPVFAALDEADSSWLFEFDFDVRPFATIYGSPTDVDEDLRTDGDPAWVRFPPLEQEDWPLPGPEGYALLVVHDDEPWAGVGHAPSLAGVQEQRIPVRLERACVLSGTVSEAGGVEVESARVENAVVTLRGALLAEPLACVTDDQGEFGFLAPAGRYELAVESRKGALGPWPVELVGEQVQLDLELQPWATIEVGGTLRSLTGTFDELDWLDELAVLELHSLSDPSLRFAADVKLSHGADAVVGSFRFDPVPAGSYELLAEPYAGVTFQPSRILVDGSATDLELLCGNAFERSTLRFLLRDAEGNRLESSGVFAWLAGERRAIIGETRSDTGTTFTVPAGASVRWVACAQGHLPAEGDWRGAGAGEEVLEVTLERGGCLGILAVDPWFCGVDQAELLLDGAPAGHTNAFGYRTLALEAEPSSVKVRKEGWAGLFSIVGFEDGTGFGLFVLAPAD